MTEHGDDFSLGRRLRAYAEGGVRPIDRSEIATAAISSGVRSRGGSQIRDRWWTLVRLSPQAAAIVLGLLLLVAALIAVAAGHPTKPLVSAGGEAIFLRTISAASVRSIDVIEIVAVRSDGAERLVRRLDLSMLPSGRSFAPFGSVSQDGWLAISTALGPTDTIPSSAAWAMFDLGDPARPARIVQYQPVIGGAWGTAGRFVTTIPNSLSGFHLQVVDARTGAATPLDPGSLPGEGPSLIWAADGSGLLVAGFDDLKAPHGRYGIAPIDGGPHVPFVPELSFPVGRRWVAAGGAFLFTCQAPSDACPGPADEYVRVTDGRSSVVPWYRGELAPARFVDASFGADGRSLWILFDRIAGTHHVVTLIRFDKPAHPVTVGSIDLGEGVVPLGFGGHSADDSTIAIRSATDDATQPVEMPIQLISPSGAHTTTHAGRLVGFVPGFVADAWPGGSEFPR